MNNKINGVLVFALMVTAGCSSKSAVKSESSESQLPVLTSPPVTSVQTSAPDQASVPASVSSPAPVLPQITVDYGFDKWQKGPLGDLFFEYDSVVISNKAEEQLKKNAAWLGSNSQKGVVLEGHCDSRGTSEYNLSLGERRSASAKEYLVRLGVAASRLETASFGDERPFDSGNTEEAWAKNRRVHFILK